MNHLVIIARWADGDLDRLPGMAAELVASQVDVIVTLKGPKHGLEPVEGQDTAVGTVSRIGFLGPASAEQVY